MVQKQKEECTRRMEQKHGADAWSRSMEQAEAWCKEKHGSSRRTELAEARTSRSMEQEHVKEAWSRCVEQKEAWSRIM
jgi:hypothetical protein